MTPLPDTCRQGGASESCYLVDLLNLLHAEIAVVLSAYVDESGAGEYGVYAIGGYAFDIDGVQRFERLWRKALDDKHLTRFHMTDFETRRGAFVDWKSTAHKNAYFRRLCEIIKGTHRLAFSVAVDTRALAALSRAERELMLDPTPYSLCLNTCFVEVGKHLHELGSTERIAYIADRVGRNVGKGHIVDAWAELHKYGDRFPEALSFAGISWADSDEVLPLQAADIWAYEVAKLAPHILGRADRPVRAAARLLGERERTKRMDVVLDEAYLKTFVDLMRGN